RRSGLPSGGFQCQVEESPLRLPDTAPDRRRDNRRLCVSESSRTCEQSAGEPSEERNNETDLESQKYRHGGPVLRTGTGDDGPDRCPAACRRAAAAVAAASAAVAAASAAAESGAGPAPVESEGILHGLRRDRDAGQG